jgi:hypothetical protein
LNHCSVALLVLELVPVLVLGFVLVLWLVPVPVQTECRLLLPLLQVLARK